MIDFHCHLDLYPNPCAIRDECLRQKLELLSVTTTPSAWKGTSRLAKDSPQIRTGLGLHPQLAHLRKHELNLFDALIHETMFVGEIGLDGSPDFKPYWNDQVFVFDHILARCAFSGKKILSIHSRGATGEVLDRLDRFRNAGVIILHWFSGTFGDLERAVSLGCWFSVGPAMLLGAKGRKLAAKMPREHVLTESDGPFAQIGGEPVKPWQLQSALDELGKVWGMADNDVAHQIHTNLSTLLTTSNQHSY